MCAWRVEFAEAGPWHAVRKGRDLCLSRRHVILFHDMGGIQCMFTVKDSLQAEHGVIFAGPN